MAWCTVENVQHRMGARYDDAKPGGVVDDTFTESVIGEAAAYIASRLSGRYALDPDLDYDDDLLQSLCADETMFRLLRYRVSADELGDGTALGDIKTDIERVLDGLASGEMALSSADAIDLTKSELRDANRLVIEDATGYGN